MKAPARSDLNRRFAQTIVGLFTAAITVGPFAAAGSAARPCAPIVSEDWVTIVVPRFPDGDQAITDYAVSPTDPRLIFVTNGRSVLSSRDGGCNFHASFSLGSAGLSYSVDGATITDLLLASRDGRRAYLAIEAHERIELPVAGIETAVRPRVVATDDGGARWREADEGLADALGSPLSLGAASDSSTVYLLVDEAEVKQGATRISTPQTLYATDDSGGSWARRNEFGSYGLEPATTDPGPVFSAVAVDRIDSSNLWVYGPGGLYHSTDGGSSFEPSTISLVQQQNGGISHVELFHVKDRPAQLLAFMSNLPRGYFSSSGGTSFSAFEEPDVITSAALAPGTRFAVGTVKGDVLYHFPESPDPADISASDRGIFDLSASASGDAQIIYGRTDRSLERRAAPEPPPTPGYKGFSVTEQRPPMPIPPLPGLEDLAEPKLTPASTEVTLASGESKILEHRLWLPGVRKVDVAFLIDQSDSMQQEIDGLRRAASTIVTELGKSNVHAYYGVAGYRDYDQTPYVRLRDMSPSGPALSKALNDLVAAGGGDETSLAALYQLATGEGQDEDGVYIAAGQQMNFRSDAVRIVVHGTDETFTDAPPNPSFERAASALRGVRAAQIGLAYENPEDPFAVVAGPPTDSLQRMAAMTGAFAPPAGVDCDDDGASELTVGTPLVCVIPSGDADEMQTSIADAIVALVNGIPDLRSVQLRVEGEVEAVKGIEPEQYPAVDFKVAQGLLFRTTVSCSGLGDDNYDVDLVATGRGAPLADASLHIVCAKAPVSADTVTLPPLIPPAPPQPPGLQQPPVQSSVNQAQAQQQAQQQAQAQAALVPQRQEQRQAATVKVMKPSANLAHAGKQGADELSFSMHTRSKRGDLPPYLPGYIVAVAMGTAFGLVIRTRARRACVVVGSRRRKAR